jgi:hypothetical protein
VSIAINDLNLSGLGLFSDTESFFSSMQDLSENELKMTFGGKKSKKSKNKSSKSSSSQSGNGSSCYCVGHPGGGVNPGGGN